MVRPRKEPTHKTSLYIPLDLYALMLKHNLGITDFVVRALRDYFDQPSSLFADVYTTWAEKRAYPGYAELADLRWLKVTYHFSEAEARTALMNLKQVWAYNLQQLHPKQLTLDEIDLEIMTKKKQLTRMKRYVREAKSDLTKTNRGR